VAKVDCKKKIMPQTFKEALFYTIVQAEPFKFLDIRSSRKCNIS